MVKNNQYGQKWSNMVKAVRKRKRRRKKGSKKVKIGQHWSTKNGQKRSKTVEMFQKKVNKKRRKKFKHKKMANTVKNS